MKTPYICIGASGVLLGLDQDDIMEVTYCFPTLKGAYDSHDKDGNDDYREEKEEKEKRDYYTKMMKHLGEVGGED